MESALVAVLPGPREPPLGRALPAHHERRCSKGPGPAISRSTKGPACSDRRSGAHTPICALLQARRGPNAAPARQRSS
eukprot:5435296-Prymnesium_polylepis.1